MAIGGLQFLVKRALDILVGLIGVALTALLLPLVALSAGAPGRASPWQQQRFIGQNGRPFTLHNFNESGLVRGRWRKLPQFWPILRGQMSLVGPRPETEEAVARYEDWHRRRLAVKPGLITPDSQDGLPDRLPDELCIDERVRQELDYINHYSLGRELRLIWRARPRSRSL